ncbi:hypothetical protein HMPREF1584_00067 [Gardnerella vaginalis JCP8481A]|nr:hypothetical protein HMPREF1584_00067 [Gardnerella vaginalis JCP8481A]
MLQNLYSNTTYTHITLQTGNEEYNFANQKTKISRIILNY